MKVPGAAVAQRPHHAHDRQQFVVVDGVLDVGLVVAVEHEDTARPTEDDGSPEPVHPGADGLLYALRVGHWGFV